MSNETTELLIERVDSYNEYGECVNTLFYIKWPCKPDDKEVHYFKMYSRDSGGFEPVAFPSIETARATARIILEGGPIGISTKTVVDRVLK